MEGIDTRISSRRMTRYVKEQLIQELTHKIESIPAQSVNSNARRQQANKAASLIILSERETRYINDEQLRQVEIFRD